MAQTNPYRSLPKGTAQIVYEGEVETFSCFRVKMGSLKGYAQYLIRAQIEDWMIHHASGKHFVGNGFGASKDDPVVPYPNPGNEDVFVLFERMIDVIRFEESFPVSGFSPSLVA